MQAIGFMGFLSLRLFSHARVWDIGPLTLHCWFSLATEEAAVLL